MLSIHFRSITRQMALCRHVSSSCTTHFHRPSVRLMFRKDYFFVFCKHGRIRHHRTFIAWTTDGQRYVVPPNLYVLPPNISTLVMFWRSTASLRATSEQDLLRRGGSHGRSLNQLCCASQALSISILVSSVTCSTPSCDAVGLVKGGGENMKPWIFARQGSARKE